MSNNLHREKHLSVGVFWGDVLYDSNVFGANESVKVGKGKQHDFILDVSRKFNSGTWQLAQVNRASALVRFREDQKGFIRANGEVLPVRQLIERDHLTPAKDGTYQLKLKAHERVDLEFDQMTFRVQWVDKTINLPRHQPQNRRENFFAVALLLATVVLGYGLSRLPSTPITVDPQRIVELVSLPTPKAIDPVVVVPPPIVAPVEVAAETKPVVVPPSAKTRAEPVKHQKSFAKPVATPPKTQASVPALPPAEEDLSDLATSLTAMDTRKVEVKAPPKRTGISNIGTLSTKSLENAPKSDRLARTEGQGTENFTGTEGMATAPSRSTSPFKGERGLARDVIDTTIRRHERKIRNCYEQQLSFSPQMRGTLQYRFTIQPNGVPAQIQLVSDELSNAKVASCVLSEIRSMKFPSPSGGVAVSVEYPFNFEAGAP